MSKLNLYKQLQGLFASLSLVLSFFSMGSVQAEAPLLVDLVVTGAIEAPNFDPQQLVFNVGQDYLLVMMNDKPFPVTFTFHKFGQSIATQLLQGAANVTQDSVVLFPATKVIWHFIPQIAGEFDFFAANSGYNQRGSVGKIVIKDPDKIKAQETEQASPAAQSSSREDKNKIATLRGKIHALSR